MSGGGSAVLPGKKIGTLLTLPDKMLHAVLYEDVRLSEIYCSFTKAIDDIDLALEISEEPCPRAYITKGDALYHLGDFEHALGK